MNDAQNELIELENYCAQMKRRFVEAMKIYGFFDGIYRELDYTSLSIPTLGIMINTQLAERLTGGLYEEYGDILFNAFEELLKASSIEYTAEGGPRFITFYHFAFQRLGFFDSNEVLFFL